MFCGLIGETICHGPNAEVGIVRDEWNRRWTMLLACHGQNEDDEGQDSTPKDTISHYHLVNGYACSLHDERDAGRAGYVRNRRIVVSALRYML